MTSRVEIVGGCQVLRASGRIDFESAANFEQSVNSILQSGGDRLIIELSEVDLLSSAGLRVLLSAAKKASHREAKLALAAPSLVVRQVFEISHFNLLFKIYPSVIEAVTALGGFQGRIEASTASSARPADKPIADQKSETALPPAVPAPKIPDAAPNRPTRVVAETSVPLKAELSLRLDLNKVVKPAPPEKAVDIKDGSTVIDEGTATVVPGIVAEPKRPMPSLRPKGPPPLPSAAPRLPGSVPIPVIAPPSPPNQGSRREAPFPSSLEVRIEGVSHSCKDGDVIGKGGQIAPAFFDRIPGLEPRHLLIGQIDGRWFIFTPKTVVHPFVFDGVTLSAGERRPLVDAEHQLEFGGQIFGLRLVPPQKRPGFLARLFQKK
jgi:anti-anti-sigma factor